jgi:hypothetical protein
MMCVKKLKFKGTGSRNGLNLVYMFGSIKASRRFAAGFFYIFQMLQLKKIVLYFWVVHLKPTLLDHVFSVYLSKVSPSYWSVQLTFDSHWLENCANSTQILFYQ